MSRCLLQALVPVLIGWPLGAQRRITVGPTPSCAQCSIELTRIARLGAEPDSVRLGSGSRVVRDSRGRYIVAPTSSRTQVAIYDANGKLVATHGGGRTAFGAGYELIYRHLVDANDSLYIFEPTRLSVLSPALVPARSIRMPTQAYDALLGPRRELVLMMNLADPLHAGYPLHVMAADGAIELSFGSDTPALLPGRRTDALRWLASARDSLIWSARRNRYEIEQWDVNGRHHLTVARAADWFPPWEDDLRAGIDQARPLPTVGSVRQDADGRLWVISWVADEHWTPAPPRPMRTVNSPAERSAQRPGSAVDRTRYLDMVLEVIDPNAGQLVVSRRFDGTMMEFIDRDLIASRTAASDGRSVIEVWRVQVRNP